MEKNIDAISINDDENRALQEYQDNYYKIVNTLLRKGITSEQTINSKNGSDYIAPSNEELEAAIDNIKNIYSAIIKRTLANEDNKETRPLYRGTQISIVEKMKENAEETAFLSTTTRKNQTRTFSRTFSKDKSVDKEADKALLKVEGDVPYINMEDVLGGMEDEILFAPAKAEIIDGIEGISPEDERHTNLYGKAYTLKLTPLEIPEMSNEEISKLKESIFDRNEEMGKTINDILEIQKYPELFDTNKLPALIEKYSKWKDDVISYCHQQFRQIKKEIENEYMPDLQVSQTGKEYIERQQQVLKDYSGKEMGSRTITWNTDIEKGTEIINTIGTLENEDSKYTIKDTQQGIGGELQLHRKEMNQFNKLTGQNEQYVYQKDKNGNEMYYRIADGKLTFKITKNNKGITIDNYDKGQLTDTFEYDKNGEALIGMEGIDKLDENYVENFFDSQIPYFEVENRKRPTHENSKSDKQTTVNTQKLGKETIDINEDVKRVDEVEKQMKEQMREHTKQREEKNQKSNDDNVR